MKLWRSSTNPATVASLTAVSSDDFAAANAADRGPISVNIPSQPVFDQVPVSLQRFNAV